MCPFVKQAVARTRKEADRIDREREQQAARRGNVVLDPETRLGRAQAVMDVLGDFQDHLSSHNLGQDTVKQYVRYVR